uniref:Aminotransferase-like n=1 Tax=Oryza sativa subsp. indica TaxID=39946 RepID=C8TFE2_ORYSI|nr:aminotransferase-like [Oryza sativa Indica Group]
MSSSASSSAAPSAEYAEHLSNLVAIPSLSHENYYFLGPVGNPDPTEFIIGETNRIPFRLANPDLGHWKNTIKSWPSLEKTPPKKSWITWYKRVSASKKVQWDEIRIGQALALTIANSAKDEPMMAAATYFWSNIINAFLFNQGPMTPTPIDITMITGLDVTSSANPMSMNTKNQFDFKTKSIGARQLGMGQLPIGLFFVDKIQYRGEISSTLMMDRLLNLQGPPLGSIENIELAKFRSKNFDRWWGEWKLHLFHQSASMYMTDLFPDVIPQTTEFSPPHQSNSGRDIEYAPGFIPNGGGPSPPVIGYHAPKTSTLLQGLIREPADAGKKRRTRSSAMDTSAPAPKKKAKLKKPKPTDDLSALDPSIEQALDEEEIGEDVDQATDEISDTERTPSASPKQTPPTPSAPAHFSRKKRIAVKKKSASTTLKPAPPPPPPPPTSPAQPSSSDKTPSAIGSHHVEEEEQSAAPAIPASSLDSLVVDCGSIRTRLHEVQALIPDELADVLTPAIYLEQHQFKLEKAKLRLAECRERKDIEATIQANRQLVHEEKTKLDQLSEGPIKSNIDRLEARKIELLAQLQECNAELDMEHKKLADLPKSVEEQKARLKSATKNVVDLTKSLKVIPGTDAQYAQAIEEVEQIRQRAISAIRQYLSQ